MLPTDTMLLRVRPGSPSRLTLMRLLRSYLLLEWQAHVVVACAVLAMAYAQAVLPLYWGSGDPLDHYRIARFLLHKPGGVLVPGRPPGMALFLILTGVAWLDTFKIMIVLYAAMSVAIPVLIFVILRKYSPTWGMVAALIAILSAVPYAYSRIMWPEQLFHFLHFVVLALVAVYFAKPADPRLPYGISLAMVALNLVRPVAVLYYWIFLVCALVFVRRPLRHVLMATVIYAGLMGGWGLADRYWGASLFPTVYMPETVTQRLFGEVYFSGGPYQFVPERPPVAAIGAADGPASTLMYAALRWLVSDPNQWMIPSEERPYLLFARFARHPEDLVQAVVRRPNFAYFDFLRTALQARYGPRTAETLMYRIASEHGNAGLPAVVGYFAHSPARLFLGGTPSSGGRNLLEMFYQAQLRKDEGLSYSLTFSGSDLLSPANGPASREFFGVIALFVRAYPQYWEHTNEWLRRYKGNPDGFVRAVSDPGMSRQSGVYEGFYWESLSKYYGVGPADRLLRRAALETIYAYPHTIGFFWDNLLHIAVIRPLGYLTEGFHGPRDFLFRFLTNPGDIAAEVRVNDFTGLAPGLVRELAGTVRYDKYVGLAYGTSHLWPWPFVVASLVLLPFCLLGPAWRLAVFLAAAYAYNVASIVVFGNRSASRYEDVFILLPVILTCVGAHFAAAMLRNRPEIAGPADVRAGLSPGVERAGPYKRFT